jgi:dihydrofolate reductase
MRKVIVSEFVSLDGVMEDPGGAEKFEQGGWTRPYWNDEIGKFKFDELFASDVLLLGRITYQAFAAAWPTMEDTGEFGERMNSLPKFGASTTLTGVEWNNSNLIKGDVAAEISKLKQQTGKDILISGSRTLVQTLIQQDLIDQFNLLVYPVVLGSGKRLFQEGRKMPLKITGTKTFSSGVVALTYESVRTEQ